MSAYQLTEQPGIVIRSEDGANIPAGHRLWDEYEAWLLAGGSPYPARVNKNTPRDRVEADCFAQAEAAIAGLRAYRDAANPTGAQAVSATRLLCRVAIVLIRLQLRKLDGTE